MRTLFRISRATVYYLVFYVAENYLFCKLYCFITKQKFRVRIWESLLLGDRSILELTSDSLIMILVFQNVINVVATAVFTSFIFTYILNKEPKILLPDKIVIRKRTSEGSNGLLTFAILIGNKSKYNIYDVKCTLTCFYNKKDHKYNAENSFVSIQPIINNYYRYSFPVNNLPIKFLEDYINKDIESYNKDFLNITITGHTNFWGNSFRVSQKYNIVDIVIGENSPDLYYDFKSPFSGKVFRRVIRWKELPKFIEASELKRQDIIKEIGLILKRLLA